MWRLGVENVLSKCTVISDFRWKQAVSLVFVISVCRVAAWLRPLPDCCSPRGEPRETGHVLAWEPVVCAARPPLLPHRRGLALLPPHRRVLAQPRVVPGEEAGQCGPHLLLQAAPQEGAAPQEVADTGEPVGWHGQGEPGFRRGQAVLELGFVV